VVHTQYLTLQNSNININVFLDSGLDPESRIGCLLLINSLIIMTTLIYKVPSNLPLPKGGFSPLFGNEGCGEIFGKNVNSIMRPLIMIYWIPHIKCGASLLEFTLGFPLPALVEDKFRGNDKRGGNDSNDNFLMNL
jgi:hypothetical protein